MKEYVKIICFCMLFCIILTGCRNQSAYKNNPTAQPDTYWISEDESICLYIPKDCTCPNADGLGYAIIQKDDIDLRVTLTFYIYCAGVNVYDNNGDFLNFEEEQSPIESEHWGGTEISKKKFEISIYKSEYFEVDSDIVLYKTDKEDVPGDIKEKLDDHPQIDKTGDGSVSSKTGDGSVS